MEAAKWVKPSSIQQIEDEIADMQTLARHAQFIEVSAVVRNLTALLAVMREENADRHRAQTPYLV